MVSCAGSEICLFPSGFDWECLWASYLGKELYNCSK